MCLARRARSSGVAIPKLDFDRDNLVSGCASFRPVGFERRSRADDPALPKHECFHVSEGSRRAPVRLGNFSSGADSYSRHRPFQLAERLLIGETRYRWPLAVSSSSGSLYGGWKKPSCSGDTIDRRGLIGFRVIQIIAVDAVGKWLSIPPFQASNRLDDATEISDGAQCLGTKTILTGLDSQRVTAGEQLLLRRSF